MPKNPSVSEIQPPPPRLVVLLACPGTSALEMAGPAEVFAMAGLRLQRLNRRRARGYRVQLISAVPGPLQPGLSGLRLQCDGDFRQLRSPIDTLLVVGGHEAWNGRGEAELLAWLRAQSQRVRRLGAICTGSFLLAEAGLLDGQRVTTHWCHAERLAAEYPALQVDPEPIFIRPPQGPATAAGVASGIDLALAMLEEDLGLDLALQVARSLVLYVRRPGWQAQHSSALALQQSHRLALRELPFWIVENLAQPLPVEVLAQRVSMSPRNFSRRFRLEFGLTPARFVAQLRAQSARQLLAEADRGRAAVAAACGFGSVDSMDRALAQSGGPMPAGA